jgi:signal transduction histidine kinase
MKFALLSLFICISCFAIAQQTAAPRFTHLTVKDGLASPLVKRIYQDKTGFIWFCTTNGLQRFDGKDFRTFYSHARDTNSLPGDDITDIIEDKFGRYWIATTVKGLCIYDPRTETYQRFNESNTPLFDEDGDHLRCIVFTTDGETALITGYNGLYVFNVRTLSCRRFRVNNSGLYNNHLGDLYHLKDQLFVVAGEGFQLFDAQKMIFYDSSNAPVLGKMIGFSRKAGGQAFYKDRFGKYWFSLWEPGLYCYDPSNGSIREIKLSPPADRKNLFNPLVHTIIGDEQGNLVLATYGIGVYVINPEDGSVVRHYLNDPSDANSLISSYGGTVFTDRANNLWISTINGISRLERPTRFTFPVLNEKNATYIASALLQTSDERIWVGTYNGDGLFEFDKDFKPLKNYSRFEGNSDFIENGIWDLRESVSGQLLICRQNGFSSIDLRTKRQDDYKDIPVLSVGAITSVQEDRGRWWLGAWQSQLISFDPATRSARTFTMPGVTYILAKDSSHLLLAVYDKGYKFFSFSLRDSSLHREPYHFFNPAYPTLTHNLNDIYHILIDKDMRYIASRIGLCVINNRTGESSLYTRSEGLLSSSVAGIVKGSPGYIWLSTAQGISLFDTATRSFQNFDQHDGLTNQEFQTRSILQLKNGLILAGNGATVACFHPDSLLVDSPIPSPVITSLRIGDRQSPLDDRGVYTIPYRESNIAINFASLDPARAGSILYAYRLNGFDKEWQYASHHNSVNYTNLDGGHYSFDVKASVNGTDWVVAPTALSFYVGSPFYKQAWFIILLVTVVFAVLYAFYRIRIQRILEMQRLRNDISKDLHDDVGATMTSISILSDVASQKVKQQETKEVHEMMEQIGSSSRNLLQNLDEIIWSINPGNDPIEKVVLRMKELAAEMLEPNKIVYELAFDTGVVQIGIPMKDRRHLFLVYKEALNNMIKYADCSHARLSMQVTAHKLVMKISDNGKGFDLLNYIPGNGLLNMRQRSQEMKARLEIITKPGEGTTIILNYPLR